MSDEAERKQKRRVIEEIPILPNDVLLNPVCEACLGNRLVRLHAM